jgi:hypothetical protein
MKIPHCFGKPNGEVSTLAGVSCLQWQGTC